jgi:hypothetical protein
MAWEKLRLEMLLKPVVIMAPEGVESEKGQMQPGGLIYMRRQIKNRCRLTTRKKRQKSLKQHNEYPRKPDRAV